jgi:hypothetical protein
MSTMNMKPDTLLILAAVGIGAWWMLSRQARAQPLRGGSLLPGSAGATMYQAPVPARDPRDPVLNAIGNRLGSWLGTRASAPAIVGPDLTAVNPGPGQWATDEYGNGLF